MTKVRQIVVFLFVIETTSAQLIGRRAGYASFVWSPVMQGMPQRSLLAYRHGMCAAELCQLRWTQINLRHGRLHVLAKGGIESVHPFA